MPFTPKILLAGALACAGASLAWQVKPPSAPAKPAAATNHYVDPAMCATCHAGIAKTFALTGMGRSFAPITAASLTTLHIKLPAQPFFHAPSQTYYTVVEREGALYEQQWQAGYNGERMNFSEKRMDYRLGSGNHGITFLHLTARHTLEQLPFGWYAEDGGTWNMDPGYEAANHAGTTRLISVECMFCHNAYPQHGAPTREGTEPVFGLPLPSGIGCQRCHGPGERHVLAATTPGATPAQIKAAIVNPARLGPTREMEVCMECHLETTSLPLPQSTLRVGREPFSFRPGEALGDFLLSFDRAPGKNPWVVVAGAAYRLRKSQCFLQTQNWAPSQRMQCTTCHDPHNIPRGQAATDHYNAICLDCHKAGGGAAKTASAAAPLPAGHKAASDCISCHMPKVRTDDAVHIVMTDHDIQLRPPAHPLAPKTEPFDGKDMVYRGPVELYYPAVLADTAQNQLDMAVAQVKDDSNLKPGIAQLTALIKKYQPQPADYYFALANALHDDAQPAASAAMYETALRHEPGDTAILLKFGQAQLDWRQWPQAEATLRQLTGETPDAAVAWALLGQALFQQGKNAEAKAALDEAVTLNPDLGEPHNFLAGLAMRAGDAAGAEAEFRKALTVEPNSVAWQTNLATLLSAEGKTAEAAYLFQLGIRLDPSFEKARLGYAQLLQAQGDLAGAETQARAAVAADPNNAEAHDLLGYVQIARGNPKGALPELRAAVRLQPGPWRANLDLAVALRQTGDAAGAAAQLSIAVQSPDPALRAAAQKLIAAP